MDPSKANDQQKREQTDGTTAKSPREQMSRTSTVSESRTSESECSVSKVEASESVKQEESTQVFEVASKGHGPGPYDRTKPWQTWKRRFENWMVVRKIKNEEKARIFVNEVGETHYDLLVGLLQGKAPEEAEYADIIKAMDDYYDPKPSVWSERSTLFRLKHEEDMSTQDWFAAINKQAVKCDLGASRELVLTAIFVAGHRTVGCREKCLEKDDLNCRSALETMLKYERNTKAASEMGNPGGQKALIAKISGSGGVVNHRKEQSSSNAVKDKKVLGYQQRKVKPGHSRGQELCIHCGLSNHRSEKCFKKDAVCQLCNGKGHVAKVCKKKTTEAKATKRYGIERQKRWAKAKQIENEDRDDDFQSGEDDYGMFSANQTNRVKPKEQKEKGSLSKEPKSHETTVNSIRSDDQLEVFKPSPELVKEMLGHWKKEPCKKLEIKVNGMSVEFELDSGADLTLINRKAWIRLGEPEIITKDFSVTGYNKQGGRLPMIGTCIVKAEYAGISAPVLMHVVDVENSSLLCGRDTIKALKIDVGKAYHESQVNSMNTHSEAKKLCDEFKEVFGPVTGSCKQKAQLMLKPDAQPVYQRARRPPYAVREKVNEMLDDMVKRGILKSVEFSHWATPIVTAPKPGGKIRICGDFKGTVNPNLDINQYPLPRIEDLLHQLNGGKSFSKLDLRDAYLQIPLEEESKELATINTEKGLFQYQRLAFGIASAPAIFQKIMEQVLAGIQGVVIYLDDITVTGKTDEEHRKSLRQVLERFKDQQFRVKREKCEFFKKEIEFLGHVVDLKGIRPSPKKVEAIMKMPDPRNVKEIESLLGMVQYYGKFIPSLSSTAAPLNKLRRKDEPWKWGKEEQEAVKKIKKALISDANLAHYDPTQKIVLATDASDYGLGAVIYHVYPDKSEKVIAYASRTLTKEECNYGQIEKEALGIVFGVDKFYQYLYGRKFTLLTDHQPLVTIFGPKAHLPAIVMRRVHRWAMKLMPYTFDIQYRNTNLFGNADGLSRLPNADEKPSKLRSKENLEIRALQSELSEMLPITKEQIRQEIRQNETLKLVKSMIRNGWPKNCKKNPELKPYFINRYDFTVEDGCIMKDHKMVIPQRFKSQVLKMLHQAHTGATKMKALARSIMWFPKMDREIESISACCDKCQQTGPEKAKVPLHLWEIPEEPWQRIHIDYAEQFLSHMWLVVVDAKSKWPEVIQTDTTTSAKTIKMLQGIFANQGIPKQIVSDNGPQFTSGEFAEFCKVNGIEHITTAPYHPQSNGEAERFVQTFKKAMNKLVDKQANIPYALAKFLLMYRTTPHPATRKSPAEMLNGRKLRTNLSCIAEKVEENAFSKRYREKQKEGFDKRTQFREFKEKDKVYTRNMKEQIPNWIAGIVKKKLSECMFLVITERGVWKRHSDQLKARIGTENVDEVYRSFLLNEEETRLNEEEGYVIVRKTIPPEKKVPEKPKEPAESRRKTETQAEEKRRTQSVPPQLRRSTRVSKKPIRYGFDTKEDKSKKAPVKRAQKQ